MTAQTRCIEHRAAFHDRRTVRTRVVPCGGVPECRAKSYLFTSESVSEGHPDKVCDQISDAILDAFLENDIKLGIADDSLVNTRLGCETL